MSPTNRKVRAFLNFMLRQVRAEALKLLNEQKPRNWFQRVGGICWNLDRKMYHASTSAEMMEYIDLELPELFAKYLDTLGAEEAESRHPLYPVGGEEEFELGAWNGDLWENPERMRLLDWLIQETA